MTRWAVGVDLGGTKTAAALVDQFGGCGPVSTVPTPAAVGPQAVLDAVASVVRQVSAGHEIAGVGVGTAGAVDAHTGRIVSSTETFRDWVGTEVAAGLTERLGCPVTLRNDVDAHALGEAWLGAGRGRESMLMVAVGTGVGGAIVLDGRLRTGAHHMAGEMGHIPVRGAEGLRCPCGRLGHLEAISSGRGMVRHYHQIGGSPEIADGRALLALVGSGDELARRAVDESAAALGRAIAGLVTVLDPELVVISGGVADAGEVWWQPMEQACRAELVDVLSGIEIVRAELGAEAALVGAARPVLEIVKETK